jgi:hypothetical protein
MKPDEEELNRKQVQNFQIPCHGYMPCPRDGAEPIQNGN